MLKALDADVEEVVPITHGPRSSPVEFEWVGSRRTLEPLSYKRGSQRTSIDAFAIARTTSGVRRGYLIEWKYVESGGDEDRSKDDDGGRTRRERYAELFEGSSLFVVPLDGLLHEPLYQYLRMGLLGWRMVSECGGDERDLGLSEFRLVSVSPGRNDAYRRLSGRNRGRYGSAVTVEEAMRNVLAEPNLFRSTSQTALLAALPDGAADQAWVRYLAERYGWGSASGTAGGGA
jgi:hypothetical protein